MTDWNKVRDDFPLTQQCIYFNSAAMSPIPLPVFNAIVANYREVLMHGDALWFDDLEKYRKLCGEIAVLMNTDSNNVCFVQNTSTAMSLVALSLKNKIKTPFNVVSTASEFPSSSIGFEYQGIPMRYVQPINSRYSTEMILEQTDNETAAVVVSYIQYATGFRQDLLSLGEALSDRGILFIVNTTQAFPFYPLDVETMHIDALTASLHKWGLTGHVGSVFFTAPSFRKQVPASWIGWLSLDAGEAFIHTAKNAPLRLHDSARQYEFGTQNFQAVNSFQTALDYLQAIGLDNIRSRMLELTDHLIQGLKKLGVSIVSPIDSPEERSPIVSFSLSDNNQDLITKLEEESIHVSFRDGNIRVSVNIFNNFEDIDKLLAALAAIMT